jgi:hypothetical protein
MNNRQRRDYLKRVGILKAKSELPYTKWSEVVSKNIEDGKKRHSEYQQMCTDTLEIQLSQMEQRMRVSCSELGFDKNETDIYINDWMEKLKPWA